MAIFLILIALSIVGMTKLRSRSKLTRITEELNGIATAVTQYAEDNNYAYPADTSRSVPPGLEKYLAGGKWPTSVWPEGVFDWDSWVNGSNQQIYQMSYRLCDISDPIASCSDPQLFPHFTRNSSIYYCISGPCVPHRDYPTDPGYCVNCKPKEINPPV